MKSSWFQTVMDKKWPLLLGGFLLGFFLTTALDSSIHKNTEYDYSDFRDNDLPNPNVDHHADKDSNEALPNRSSPNSEFTESPIELINRRYSSYYTIFQDPIKKEALKIRKVIENRTNYLGFLQAFDFSIEEKNLIIDLLTEKEISLLEVFANNVNLHGELKSLEALAEYNVLTEDIDNQIKSEFGTETYNLLEEYRLAIPQLKNFNDLNAVYLDNNEPLSLSQRILLMKSMNTWANGANENERLKIVGQVLSESQYEIFEDYLLMQEQIDKGNTILKGL